MWQEMKQWLKRRNEERVIIQYLVFTKHQVSQNSENFIKLSNPRTLDPEFTAERNGRILGMYEPNGPSVFHSSPPLPEDATQTHCVIFLVPFLSHQSCLRAAWYPGEDTEVTDK